MEQLFTNTKAEKVKEWQSTITDQLQACETNENLKDYKDLVQSRWHQLIAFTSESSSPSKLSPTSRDLKANIFSKSEPVKEAFLKSYKKKLQGFFQGLANASDRLNTVQREVEGLLSQQP